MTTCVYLDIALWILLFAAALTGLRFIRAESPNADLLVEVLNRMESGCFPEGEAVDKEEHPGLHNKA